MGMFFPVAQLSLICCDNVEAALKSCRSENGLVLRRMEVVEFLQTLTGKDKETFMKNPDKLNKICLKIWQIFSNCISYFLSTTLASNQKMFVFRLSAIDGFIKNVGKTVLKTPDYIEKAKK